MHELSTAKRASTRTIATKALRRKTPGDTDPRNRDPLSTSTVSAWEPGKHFGTYTERPIAYGGGRPVETGVVQRICVDYYIESPFTETKTRWADYLKKVKELLENYDKHAKGTLEHRCARLADAYLGLLDRRTGNARSASG